MRLKSPFIEVCLIATFLLLREEDAGMGFSVIVSSTIILIGLLVFTGAISAAVLSTISTLARLQNLTIKDGDSANVRIELFIDDIGASKIRLSIRNAGSRSVFLKRGDYNWNSLIVSYRNVYWRSYLLEEYNIVEIRVAGTNYTFNLDSHKSLNPNEEALIEAYLPIGAPEIPINSPVTVVFASHYGVVAVGEGVREP